MEHFGRTKLPAIPAPSSTPHLEGTFIQAFESVLHQ